MTETKKPCRGRFTRLFGPTPQPLDLSIHINLYAVMQNFEIFNVSLCALSDGPIVNYYALAVFEGCDASNQTQEEAKDMTEEAKAMRKMRFKGTVNEPR